MLSDWIIWMDFGILNWIQDNLTNGIMNKLMPAISFLGNKGWFFIVVAVILLLFPKYRKWGAGMGVSLGLGFLFGNLMLKNIVARTRPYDMVEHVTLLVNKLSDYSFPSGHTLAAFEFFTVICLMPVRKIYKVIAGILAFSMAFSRMYLYVHFPTDVIAGMILGTLFGIMGVRIVEMVAEEKRMKMQ